MEDNILLMPFLDASESFTHGFECGMFWIKFSLNEHFDKIPIHTKNAEQIKMMCIHFGYEFFIDKSHIDGWSYLTACPIDISQLIN